MNQIERLWASPGATGAARESCLFVPFSEKKRPPRESLPDQCPPKCCAFRQKKNGFPARVCRFPRDLDEICGFGVATRLGNPATKHFFVGASDVWRRIREERSHSRRRCVAHFLYNHSVQFTSTELDDLIVLTGSLFSTLIRFSLSKHPGTSTRI